MGLWLAEAIMYVVFACKDCGHRYRVPRRHAGKKFACRHCRWPLTVPGRPISGSDDAARPAVGPGADAKTG